jgi:hypothetical protein
MAIASTWLCRPAVKLIQFAILETLAMWIASLLRLPNRRWLDRANTRRRAGPLRRAFVPRLEVLEGRTMLSTQTVLNILDNGVGSLRDAIGKAKSGDTIAFAPALDGQTITLTSDQITINKSLDIEGPGTGLLTISGNDANRIFDISGGLSVTIAGLSLVHGLGKGGVTGQDTGGGGGGAILNGGGTVSLANDLFANNQSLNHGGAISNGPSSVLTVVNSSFVSNRAVGQIGAAFAEGGAIWNTDNSDHNRAEGAGASALVIGCTFLANQALGADGGNTTGTLSETNGGAIHSEGIDYLTIKNSTFIDNEAIAGDGGTGKGAKISTVDVATGGAVANDNGLHFDVDGCTFSYNQAMGGSNASSDSGNIGQGAGGAIVSEGSATITNSSFDHNLAQGGSGNTGGSGVVLNGRGIGGAIASFYVGVSITVNNCTFTANQAVGGAGDTGGLVVGMGVGGGMDSERGGTATIANSTFTGNQAVGGAGAVGQNGADGHGGGIANVLGATLTVNGCTLTGNQAIGGAGGTAANGGDGLGGAIYNDGVSIWPVNAGTPASLTVTGSTLTGNQATGGAAGSGGSVGQGIGGGVYFATGAIVGLDTLTIISGNTASTSNNDVFGLFITR